MSKTEIEEIAALFKSPEEWSAFVELADKKKEIESYFLTDIENEIKKWFRELFKLNFEARTNDGIQSTEVFQSNNTMHWATMQKTIAELPCGKMATTRDEFEHAYVQE